MKDNNVNEQIKQTTKDELTKEWQAEYERQANILLDNRAILKEFNKLCKEYDYLLFHIMEVSATPPTIVKVNVVYMGQPVAEVSITKDNVYISTKDHDESNKKNFDCKLKLENEDFRSEVTDKFLKYFKGAIPKNKLNEKALAENLLIKEFRKTSSVGKLLLGVQPICIENLVYPLPIITKGNQHEHIKLLARSKIRKITIIEVMDEGEKQEAVLKRATDKAVVLLNLLKTEKIGDLYYKLFGFHGRNPINHTIKVSVAVNKTLKGEQFEPYEAEVGTDIIQYHFMQYEMNKDNTKLSTIKTTLNKQV